MGSAERLSLLLTTRLRGYREECAGCRVGENRGSRACSGRRLAESRREVLHLCGWRSKWHTRASQRGVRTELTRDIKVVGLTYIGLVVHWVGKLILIVELAEEVHAEGIVSGAGRGECPWPCQRVHRVEEQECLPAGGAEARARRWGGVAAIKADGFLEVIQGLVLLQVLPAC